MSVDTSSGIDIDTTDLLERDEDPEKPVKIRVDRNYNLTESERSTDFVDYIEEWDIKEVLIANMVKKQILIYPDLCFKALGLPISENARLTPRLRRWSYKNLIEPANFARSKWFEPDPRMLSVPKNDIDTGLIEDALAGLSAVVGSKLIFVDERFVAQFFWNGSIKALAKGTYLYSDPIMERIEEQSRSVRETKQIPRNRFLRKAIRLWYKLELGIQVRISNKWHTPIPLLRNPYLWKKNLKPLLAHYYLTLDFTQI